jgi:cadmium resistance protein CadD (predicted permease)
VAGGIIAEAAGLFAVSNVDDILMLSLFFGRSAGQPARSGGSWPGSISASPPS